MKLLLTGLASLGLMLSASAAEAPSGIPRLALRAYAEVSGTMILLSDLVPQDAPDYVREEGARIPLGLAPQTGTTRVLAASVVVAAVERAGLPKDVFAVPDRVTIIRAGRRLSDREVWAAIERYLKVHPASAIQGIQQDELMFNAGYSIPPEARIEVARVTSDKTTKAVQVHLKIEGAEGVLPICVRVRNTEPFVSEMTGLAAKPSLIYMSQKPNTKQLILVEPKTIARLHLHSADSDMLLDVRPLERGALDQTIRVRLASSAKTLQARVVGANALDATF